MLSTILGLLFLSTTTPSWDEAMKTPTLDQEVYIYQLIDCESSASSTIKILDSNGKHSFGAMMFQMETWLTQSKKYNLGYTEKDIYDWRKQKHLAHLMLKDGGESHWYNCSKKLGKYPK